MTSTDVNTEVQDFKYHLTKSYNVVIVSTTYLLFGLPFSYFINKISSDADKNTNKLLLLISIVFEVGLTVLFTYFLHRVMERLPLPLLGSARMKRRVIAEVRASIVIAFSMFALQVKLLHKIQLLFDSKITPCVCV